MDSLISFIAEYFYVIVVLLAGGLVLWRYRNRLVELGIAGVVILGVAYILSKIATNLISDPRPFIETGVPALIHSATDNGFPSDHTLLLASVAATLTLVSWRAGLVFLGLALLVGLARVYVRVHHLLDIAGSVALVGVAFGIYLLGKLAWEKMGWKLLNRTS